MNFQWMVKNSVLNPFDSIMGEKKQPKKPDGGRKMVLGFSPEPLLALISGILILIFPRVLNFIIAIYLIVYGILGLVR